jgi:2Fe-2S ferredoxin
MEDCISIHIVDNENNQRTLEIPLGISMSLMEALKAHEEPIEATCGGMALCATCHIEVLNDIQINPCTDAELDMLDTLPVVKKGSRLACQIPVTKEIDGLTIRLAGELVV